MSMMHSSGHQQPLGGVPRRLFLRQALRLDSHRAGWLQVQQGRVWLTRDGGGPDHVLSAGERHWLGRGQRWVVETWRAGQPAVLCWDAGAGAVTQPLMVPPVRPAGPGTAGAAPAWSALARGLRGLAAGLAAAARSAEARASRAQGAIAPGLSSACSGTVQ